MQRLRPRALRVVVLVVVALLLPALSGCGPAATPVRGTGPIVITPPVGGPGMKTIHFAGGCFWGIQKYLDQIHGVAATEVGYANGASNSATYGDGSGYAEAVRVDYDPKVAPLPFLLRVFYAAIDPTSVDQQGNDIGTEYRSGIYFTDPADLAVIKASLATLQKQFQAPIAIEAGPLKTYTKAEDYHQKYLVKNPGGYCHIPLSLFAQAAAARPVASDFATETAAPTAP